MSRNRKRKRVQRRQAAKRKPNANRCTLVEGFGAITGFTRPPMPVIRIARTETPPCVRVFTQQKMHGALIAGHARRKKKETAT